MSDVLERVAAPLGRRAVASTRSTDLAELLAPVPATLQPPQHRSALAIAASHPSAPARPPADAQVLVRPLGLPTCIGRTQGGPSAPLQRTRAAQQAPARRRNRRRRRNAAMPAAAPAALPLPPNSVDASQSVLLLCRGSSMATRLHKAFHQLCESVYLKDLEQSSVDASRGHVSEDELDDLLRKLDSAKGDVSNTFDPFIEAVPQVVAGRLVSRLFLCGCLWHSSTHPTLTWCLVPRCMRCAPSVLRTKCAPANNANARCALPHVLCRPGCACGVSRPV